MKMAIDRAVCLLAAAAILCIMCSCAGQGNIPAGTAAAQTVLPAPVLLSTGARTTSGAPVGIWVRWTRNTSGLAQGYYLYRDTESIPDPPAGEGIDPTLRVNAGQMIAQPPSGTEVTFNDLFACVPGQTYYYRVTVVDNLDQESDPSNEVSWTVQGQNVSGLNPTSAYWGDSITILGDTFGAYNAATDSVHFPAIGGGEVEGLIEQPADWTDTSIKVTVPDNAVTGKVRVVIDATIAQSDGDLTVLNAWIGSVSPNPGFLEQEIIITGGNYGATRGSSTVMIGTHDVSSTVTFWGPSQIKLAPPAAVVTAGDLVITVAAHASNRVLWTPRPEIQLVSLLAPEAGEELVLHGRLFEATPGEVRLDGSTPLGSSAWTGDEITVTIAGEPGAHTLVVMTDSGLSSNGFAITIAEPLSVTMEGLTPGTVYTPAAPPTITITTQADAETVELVIDGTVKDTFLSPFDDFTLPVAGLSNGTHQLKLVAHRRASTAESAQADVVVYSLVGDIDGNGQVGDSDRAALELYLGLTPASPGFWPWYDTDGDGTVTEADLSLVGYNYGNTLPPPLP